MENYRYVKKTTKIFIIAVAIFLLGPFFVFAYGTETHSALTGETIEFFNSHFADKTFSAGEKEIIKKGSVDEDDAPRWMRHFYDPVYERGLWGQLSSKEWASATLEQAGFASIGLGSVKEFFSAEDDHSWERAVYEYVWGDKERGLEALGHVLHLIQDSSVPDHTRNDPHPPLFHFGSPYEGWAGKFNNETINVVSKLGNDKPVAFVILDEYFNNIASYSNNNFFSKDSIETYDIPKPIRVGSENISGEIILFAYNVDENGNEFRLAKVFIDPSNPDDFSVFVDKTDELLTDYWSRLSKQAVLHGAGVIKLFFDEVAREKETKTLYNKNKTWAQRIFDSTRDAIFNIASVFYGSSVTPADLENPEDNLAVAPPSEQTVAIVTPILEPDPALESDTEPQTENQEQTLQEDTTEAESPSNEPLTETASEETGEPNDPIRDQFGLVILPPGGGGIGGGGSPPPSQQENEEFEDEEELADTTSPAHPTIMKPADFSQTFIQNIIAFSGTAEVNALITQDFDSSTTTAKNGSWSLALILPQGTSTIQFFATDASGNISVPTSVEFFVDSNGPDLTFDILECENSLTSGCLSTSTSATLEWSSSAEDLASYELNCEASGAQCENFPKTFEATTTIKTSETLNDFISYTFTLKAKDETGNETEISRQIEMASLPVVINEIAWMGTASSSADEWIELKNNTSQEISLANWVLRAGDDTPKIYLTGVIPAGGYYLLERKDDDTISDVASDQPPYGNDGASWALNNNGERLFLEKINDGATSTIDEVVKCGNKWCAGDKNSKKTMERIDPTSSGISAGNWATALGEFILNGKDASGASIKGTPKSRNSVNHLVNVSSTISSDKTLTKSGSPYLIGRNGIVVAIGTTLTVKPGTVIKFVANNEPSLIINGTIKANGTQDEPVVFTSFADDEHGGDMNNDGICEPENASSSAACPGAGSWKQILVTSSSQNSEFLNTIIRYGGRWFNNMEMRSMVAVDGTDVLFSGVTIEKSRKHGLYIKLSSSQISNSIFRDNNVDTAQNLGGIQAGLYVAGGAPTISGSIFENNRLGIYSGSAPQANISSNVFNNNSFSAIESLGAVAYFSANSGAENGLNAIVLNGDIAYGAVGTTTLGKNLLSYVIKRQVNVQNGATLSFEPGVVIKGYYSNGGNAGRLKIKSGGKIYFEGSSPSDLIFTTVADNSVGGNVLGTTTIPVTGSWYGIDIEKDGIINMRGFTLRYAGGLITLQSGVGKHGLIVAKGKGYIDNAIFENNFRVGLRLDDVDMFSVSNSTFQNHTEKESIHQEAVAILVFNSFLNLSNITFQNNEIDIKGSGNYSVSCLENCGSPITDPDPL